MSGAIPIIYRDEFLILIPPRTRHSGRYVLGWSARVFAREDDAREQLARMTGDPILLSAREAASAPKLARDNAALVAALERYVVQEETAAPYSASPMRLEARALLSRLAGPVSPKDGAR